MAIGGVGDGAGLAFSPLAGAVDFGRAGPPGETCVAGFSDAWSASSPTACDATAAAIAMIGRARRGGPERDRAMTIGKVPPLVIG
jgi:hypothetical protein